MSGCRDAMCSLLVDESLPEDRERKDSKPMAVVEIY